MEITIVHAVLGIMAIIYIVLVPVFHFILTERVRTIESIIMSRSPRNRPALVRKKESAKKDIILSFFWPLLLMRGKRHHNEKKR